MQRPGRLGRLPPPNLRPASAAATRSQTTTAPTRTRPAQPPDRRRPEMARTRNAPEPPAQLRGLPAVMWTHEETAAFLKIPPATLHQMNSKRTGPASYRVGR